ncbi:SF1B family DNA helicase RecD2 [Enterococcus timonensis]|uniref:SF1B family DNA helicase RecD2 n=1 Tax=Enterococcus timonensis TaxID=1852364 RepID=UPI000AE7ECAC|nr:ATP-dependent RecD-like DNA helicase [Enterococcus timonensis]
MPQEMNLFNNQQHFITGTIVAVFFENPGNFYKVLLVRVTETDLDLPEPEIVVTGSFGQTQEEETYRFVGNTVDHPRYGLQFQAESYQKERPTTASGMIQYLASDKFPGIGKITAEKIVTEFGVDALDKILADPEALKKIPSLNEKKRQMLISTLKENLGMEQQIMGLTALGFGTQLAFAIYRVYENEALETVKENPYALVEDVEGIGFTRADNLAENLGIPADSPQRIKACLLHCLLENSLNTGDTYIEAKPLLVQTLQLLEKARPIAIAPKFVAEMLLQLEEEGKLQREGLKIFENSLYFAEWGITSSIERLLARRKKIHYPADEMKKSFAACEKFLSITYDASQKNAIEQAITSPLFVLTGGPGTGKTTIVKGIVSLFAELNGLSLDLNDYTDAIFPILLGAPTGRAAKRLNETTELPAATIHRLLGLTGREKSSVNTARELEGGLLIVDEMSMVDTWLANTLLKSIPDNMQVIFVGDKDQLPSVGPGQVLHDLLQAEKIPKAELKKIYRQEDGSSIISLAHEIKEGRLPEDFTKNQRDRSYFPAHANQIESLIGQIAEKAKNKNFSYMDIQVLAPMYKGPAGINVLNRQLQEIFNGNADKRKKEVHFNDGIFRIGDKVLQLVNDNEQNVFNGDLGQIVGLQLAKDTEDKVDELTIEFDATEVTYKRNEWNKITLAYCTSIHKSQGSEFEMVILPMVHQYSRMLQRNLLYTAVTRSKNLLILLGEESAFQACVKNLSASRATTLVEKLQGDLKQEIRLELEMYEKGELVGHLVEEKETSYQVAGNTTQQPEETTASKTDATIKLKPVEKVETPIIDQDSDTLPEDISSQNFRLTPENLWSIDPMIGMNQLTPLDLMK